MSNQPVLFPELEPAVQEVFAELATRPIGGLSSSSGQRSHERPASPSHGLARNSDPETSKQTALSVDVSQLEKQVLEALRANVLGLTAEELSGITGLPLNTVSPRTRPMVNKGLIFDSGYTRKTSSGKSAIVWRARL